MTFRTGVASALLATAAILAPAAPVAAQVAATANYDLPAQDLETSLRAVARSSGHQIIIASSAVEGRTAPALKGQYSFEQAVRALLAGTDIPIQITQSAILIGDSGSAVAAPADNQVSDEDAITVTGSRIKGGRLASPQITINREGITRAGFGDMGEALRALPQNFGGGQNPGVGRGAVAGGLTNQNVTGGSAVNLRGIGADATLTLLNGHRLAFGGLAQGIDISAIPIDAIERVDIVPDGASALYGSDAVAGVVNVILRRSFDGLSLRTRLGSSTDGGGFSQQYQAAFGQQWQGGGLLAAYGYRRDARIDAADRDYTTYLGEPFPLIPGQSNHSLTLSANQTIAGGGEFSIDANYNKRKFSVNRLAAGVLQRSNTDDETFAVAPSLLLPVGPAWRLSITGVYGETRTNNFTAGFSGNTQLYASGLCYCHRIYGAEGYFEGPVFAISGGTVRAVVGGGFRSNRYQAIGVTSRNGGSEQDRFLFGEISVPLVSGLNDAPWLHALTLSAAARYDSYKLAGDVLTPRLGLVYSPSAAVDFKASWGRSFKAPRLSDQFERAGGILFPPSFFLGSNAPPGSTALILAGGSRDLRPERATTQSWSVDIHPESVPGLSVELSYFRINYRDRVLAPIGNYSDSLNAIYSDVVILNPTLDQVNAAIAGTDFFQNATGGAFDPANVAYLVNNYVRNVASQKIKGVDVTLSYSTPMAGGQLAASVGGSWIESRQKNSQSTNYFDLAGTAWNAPHLRFRGNIGWSGSGFDLFAYSNLIGGVEDRRRLPYRDGKSMLTFDLSASYTLASNNPWLDGLKAQLTVSNLFNRRPPYLQPAAFAEPYDSTNYSPVGRFIALSLSHRL
ncbi:TonB-dependent receptor [Sphingopyxis macrogoltabida]|uniref:Secretin/TonB short N-terminal domain-containing protein n=1 Tax=Sphingopyxis macrogoltabida TaxID=33050 RepID=A0AAC9AZV3_SPHMC|nr:TonB-dependent receptor [Sphingopyxis macrogoltabida]ALJ16611.1 hypothetical protein LH19_27810 [Sphingopyxis macrogoltabida]AMU92839.1 hypothetical protein ATM17_31785 [Sphingopyxis macrogoltabida]